MLSPKPELDTMQPLMGVPAFGGLLLGGSVHRHALLITVFHATQ
jgi:hypothetical protein